MKPDYMIYKIGWVKGTEVTEGAGGRATGALGCMLVYFPDSVSCFSTAPVSIGTIIVEYLF